MAKRIKATATVRLLVTVDLGWGEDCQISQVWDQSSEQARIAVGEAVKKIHDVELVRANVSSVTVIAQEE